MSLIILSAQTHLNLLHHTSFLRGRVTPFICFDNDGISLDEFEQTELSKVCSLRNMYGNFAYADIPKGEPYGSIMVRNYALGERFDCSFINATDDIEFQEDSITIAYECLVTHFKDLDGVVGFSQDLDHDKGGVFLMGKKFMDRYLDQNICVFNPQYWHFGAQEVRWLAEKLDRFVYCKEAMVNHAHPSLGVVPIDETHNDARIKAQEDHTLMISAELRQSK